MTLRGAWLPTHFGLSPSIGINGAQAGIFDGGSAGKLWRAESFRQQKQ
jgi:hypothetical protein